MNVVVYDAHSNTEQWKRALQDLPKSLQDVYFLPEYLQLFYHGDEAAGRLFVFEDNGERWMKAGILRPTVTGETTTDFESAYGYGGPLSTSEDPDFLHKAHQAYTDWMVEQQVVAEFSRYHPLLSSERWESTNVAVEADGRTLSIDLSTPPTFTGTVLNKYKRSIKEGVVIEEVDAVEGMSTFREMYVKNMEILDADSFYYFDDQHFDNLAKLTSEHGFLLVAMREKHWLAASIFLQGKESLHYHLSATDFGARVPGTINAIIHEAGTRGFNRGLKALHLGGGRTRAEDDSLFAFKKGMSTDEHTYCIGKRVVQASAYETLCSRWRSHHPELVEKFGNRILCYRYH